MIGIRTSAIVLVILAAALGLAVAVYELTRPKEVSAQEAVQRACDQTAVSDYDFTASFSGSDGESTVSALPRPRVRNTGKTRGTFGLTPMESWPGRG